MWSDKTKLIWQIWLVTKGLSFEFLSRFHEADLKAYLDKLEAVK